MNKDLYVDKKDQPSIEAERSREDKDGGKDTEVIGSVSIAAKFCL